jgi:hypothetical protein
MDKAEKTLESLHSSKSISGFSIYELSDLPIEAYRDTFLEVLDGDPRRAVVLLEQMQMLDSVGDFIGGSANQQFELAAFGLILMDRLIQNKVDRKDGWESMFLYEQMMECQELIRLPSPETVRRDIIERAARERHKENHAMKRQAIEYYEAHRLEYSSIDAAAAAIARKIVPVTFRTVQGWISEHLRSSRRL